MTSADSSSAMLRAIIDGFYESAAEDLVAPFAKAYFEVLESIVDVWPVERTGVFALHAFPRTAGTTALADAYLDRADPPAWLRRIVVEERHELVRRLTAQEFDRTGA